MTSESLLLRLQRELSPTEEARKRVKTSVFRRIEGPEVIRKALGEVVPKEETRLRLWQGVLARITVPRIDGIFDVLRSFLHPEDDRRRAVKMHLMARLQPVPVRATYRAPKWVAAFALVLVALRISPMLFLAPSSSAQSSVILVPTRGEVALSLQGYWQPISGEVEVQEGVRINTEEGEATIILHDDGTIRLAPFSTIILHDISDRPEEAAGGPTLTVERGHVWFQGLLPQYLRGITVSVLGGGSVTVHGGSVALMAKENGEADVRVWDRHAIVETLSQSETLVAGERTTLAAGTEFRVRAIADDEYEEPWVAQNLRRDAVHQREVAQMQKERRAARAGILPTSRFYPVKRVAEKMDMFMTLDSQARIQKKLDLASTRLDEAAAMIAEGSSGAELPVEEYKRALIEVASGTGGNMLTEEMIKRQIAENTAETAAALPDDESYLLKKAVLETSAELQPDVVDGRDVQGMLLLDTLDVLQQAIEDGDTEQAKETYESLKPRLTTLQEEGDEGGELKPEVKKEVLTILEDAAQSLQEQTGTGTGAVIAEELKNGLKPYLPLPQRPSYVPLTDEQIDAMVAGMYQRIFLFGQPRSRWNQLQYEIGQLDGHPDEGRILRRLYHALPENGLARYVRTAIQDQREDQEEEGL